MSKIKLLVEIDEEDYGDFWDWFESVPSELYDAKPYDDSGDLISRSELKKAIEEVEDNYDGYEPNDLGKFMYKVGDLIDNAPTVDYTNELEELKELRDTMEMIKKHYILVEKGVRDNPNDLMIGRVMGGAE